MVAAASILPGAGAGFEKSSPVSAQQKMFFPPAQIVRVLAINTRRRVVCDLNSRQPASFNYLPGIRQVAALSLYIQGSDIPGRISVWHKYYLIRKRENSQL